jgi:hypothetical protein
MKFYTFNGEDLGVVAARTTYFQQTGPVKAWDIESQYLDKRIKYGDRLTLSVLSEFAVNDDTLPFR